MRSTFDLGRVKSGFGQVLLSSNLSRGINISSYLGYVYDDCISLLGSLPRPSVSFIKRSANCTAHALAAAVSSQSAPRVWVDTPPECIVRFFN